VSNAGETVDGRSDQLVLAAGVRLGKYELLRRLAVGGMAEIFLARAVGIEGFEKLVVLKSILGQHAGDEQFVRMFLDEARLAATFHHPNVAQVFDIGRVGQQHFFTMEYIEGQDLRQVLAAARQRSEGLPLEHAIAIVIGASAGLHYAHERTGPDGQPLRIVHRDVSPSNVLVSYDGCVKVVDFGIAKASTHKAATRTGFIKGKVLCMSPEQCRGETLDRRSDIFALGILLYELTVSKRPFEGENDYAILHQIVDKDVIPPSAHRPDYPPALETIVLRALKRDREERYATAQELQIDLETFARENDLVVSPIELGRFMNELFADAKAASLRLADDALATAATDATGSRLAVESSVIELPKVPARGALRRSAGLIAAGLVLAAGVGGIAKRWVAPARATPATSETTATATPSITLKIEPPAASTETSRQDETIVPPAPPSHPAKAKPAHRARPAVKSAPSEPDLDAPFPR
jgi:serine/threonine protein kinase